MGEYKLRVRILGLQSSSQLYHFQKQLLLIVFEGSLYRRPIWCSIHGETKDFLNVAIAAVLYLVFYKRNRVGNMVSPYMNE